MSKRLYIATEALKAILTGLFSNPQHCGWTVEGNVIAAYEYADAMLKNEEI